MFANLFNDKGIDLWQMWECIEMSLKKIDLYLNILFSFDMLNLMWTIASEMAYKYFYLPKNRWKNDSLLVSSAYR